MRKKIKDYLSKHGETIILSVIPISTIFMMGGMILQNFTVFIIGYLVGFTIPIAVNVLA